MLHFNALNVAAAVGIEAGDEVLCNGPLFNTGPLNILTTPALAAGATVTVLREFDPGATLAAIERRRITLGISTPAMTKALVSHPDWDATDLSSLRCVITGSTIVREDALAPWFDRGVCVLQDYGLTEAMPVVTLVPREDAFRLRGTAGRPVAHCRVRIAADDGSPVAPGEVGEVLVQGPTVMPEYWRNPEATREVFHADGWLRTGDAGRFDAEGMLSIVDRLKEVIIVGSCNVYPADVESVLADCPEIAEAAVVGRPDDELGEVPVAFVVLRRAGRDERRRRQGVVRGAARRLQAPAGRRVHRRPAAQRDRQGAGRRAAPVAHMSNCQANAAAGSRAKLPSTSTRS